MDRSRWYYYDRDKGNAFEDWIKVKGIEVTQFEVDEPILLTGFTTR